MKAAGALTGYAGLGAFNPLSLKSAQPFVIQNGNSLYLVTPPSARRGMGYLGRRGMGIVSRRRGFGDVCVPGPYGSDANGPLCLDQNTGSPISCADPRCGAAASTPSNAATAYAPGPTQFATYTFGSSSTTTDTLDSYLQMQVGFLTAQSVAALVNQGISGPSDFAGVLSALAQGYCADEPVPDCSNMSALVAKYAAIAAAAFANVPASQWNPATFTAYAYDPGVIPPANPPATSLGPISPTRGGAGASGGSGALNVGGGGGSKTVTPTTATISNVSRPGQPFQVGDSWSLVISGTPGQPVTGSASQNGASLGTTPFGNTNSSGNLPITGTFAPGTVGTWQEIWTVGSQSAPALNFTVSAAPSGGSSTGGGSSSSGSSGGSSSTSTSTGSSLSDFLSSDITLFGFNIPYWAIGGGLLVFAFFMFSGGGRRR